jgi:ribosomal protein L7/L12
LRKKNLIGAIKVYRERHKTSLRDAKDAVEALQKRLGL